MICTTPGCPTTVDAGSHCPRCRVVRRTRDKRQRGTRQQQGYDAEHQRVRCTWQPIVERGAAVCWRCDQAIPAGSAWDLGHADDGSHAGPEHPSCNRSAGARASHTDR